MPTQKWSNVAGDYCHEICKDKDGNWIDEKGVSFSKIVQSELNELFSCTEESDPLELVIDFYSNGYYDPGRISGPPENCYPPEGEDERLLDNVTVAGKELSGPVQEAFMSHFQEEIDEVELDTSSPDDIEPDYDDE